MESTSRSVFPVAPDDPSAVYPQGAVGDGLADDGPAIQQAIDRVQAERGSGIVLIPEGTYRIGSTIHLWRGIRLIGVGARRPRFVLGPGSSGFAGPESRYVVRFCDERPKGPAAEVPDAKNTTFFSGVNNIDFDLGEGNLAAVACRFRVAQLSSIENCDFHVGTARAAIEAIGNEIENCRFSGGEFALVTANGTSAGWQALVADCVFEGQRSACIETERAGLTLVRCRFADAPRAVQVREGCVEQLYALECAFVRLGDAAMLLGRGDDPALQVHADQCVCEDVACFARFGDDSRPPVLAPARRYSIDLSHGLRIERGGQGEWTRRHATEVLAAEDDGEVAAGEKDYPPMAGVDSWVSVRRYGAVGDGVADDTHAIKLAIASHRAVYLPTGRYRVSQTLVLRHDTVLVGLHPEATMLVLADATPGFDDADQPQALVRAPHNGRNVLSGVGFSAGRNRGSIALEWCASRHSLVDDVWFDWGGHGSDAKGEDQLHSLYVHDGGGGVIKNVWIANILAREGLLVSETDERGRAYLVSVEHHREAEVRLRNVRNWSFIALQTEENLGSDQATAVEIERCADVEFVSLFLYRVIAHTAGHPNGVWIAGSRDIAIRGVHCFSWGKFPFDNSVHVEGGASIPEREATLIAM